MKFLFLIIPFLFFQINLVSAQDIIYLKSGSEINCKIIKAENKVIVYELPEVSGTDIQTIHQSKVYMIKYRDGSTKLIDVVDDVEVEENVENTYIPGKTVKYKKEKVIDTDFRNTIFLGGGSTVGGPLGIYYEYLTLPKSSIILGISMLEDSFDEPIGFGIGVRYYSSNFRSYFSMIYGTGSNAEDGEGTNWHKNYLQGISLMYGYRFYIISHLSIDLELGGRIITEKMHTDFPPFFLAGGLGIAAHF